METMKPALKRGRYVWDRINMPTSEFQERVKKVQKEMKKEKIDVLLLYGNGPDKYGDSCYISHYYSGMGAELTILPQKGPVTLVFGGGSRGIQYVTVTTWVDDIRPTGDMAKACVNYLKENKLLPSTIGLVGLRQYMPYFQLKSLREALKDCKIVDADHIISDMRLVKSQKEIDQIRRASRILTHAFSSVLDVPLDTMKEIYLESVMDRDARLEGAEDVRILIARPREAKLVFRPAEDMPLSNGERVIIYMTTEFEKYWSECFRTFKLESSRLVPEIHPNISDLYNRVLKGMIPGKTISQFYKETEAELKKNKAEYIADYGLGNGIGLSLQEPPFINENEIKQLRKGMCLTLHLALQEKELGATMLGNTIYLSKEGPEILSA